MKRKEFEKTDYRTFSVSFDYNGKRYVSQTRYVTHMMKSVLDWLYQNGYQFSDPTIHRGKLSRLYSPREYQSISQISANVHRLPNGCYFPYLRDEYHCSTIITGMLESQGCKNIEFDRTVTYTQPLIHINNKATKYDNINFSLEN